jgi:hypothetical protein
MLGTFKKKEANKLGKIIFCWHPQGQCRKEQDPEKDPDPYQNVTDPEPWNRYSFRTYTDKNWGPGFVNWSDGTVVPVLYSILKPL